jgi:hypothetical protein
MMSGSECSVELATLLGMVGIWLRLERRLTKVEDRVQERYRDKKATEERLERIEKWLPNK